MGTARFDVTERGLTLVELLIALLLGVLLMLGASRFFLQSKISFLQDEEMARLQESGRYALRYLTRELSMAGYYGNVLRGSGIANGIAYSDAASCYAFMLRPAQPVVHVNDVASMADFSASNLPLGGVEPCLNVSDVYPGTDVLVLRRVKDRPTATSGVLSAGADLHGDTVYLQVEKDDASIALKNDFVSAPHDSELWQYWPQILYVRKYAIDIDDGIPTLCRIRISTNSNKMANTECLVQGVEDIQVEFGVDKTGDGRVDIYTASPDATEIARARVARLYLLVRSLDQITGPGIQKSVQLGSKNVSLADRYYRRVFQTTVVLRNTGIVGF